MKRRARCERKAAWDHAEHEGPRMDSWHAALQAKSAIRLVAITVNQKAGLRRFATSRLSYVSS